MKPIKRVLFIVTIILLVAAFGTSAFLVVNYLKGSKDSQNRYEDLANQVSSATTVATVPTTQESTAQDETTAPTAPTEPKPIEEYVALHEQNNDMVGWIQIEGTKIDYPVLQTPNEKDFYLKRDFDKKNSEWGAIYAWEKADINKPSDNITLFGHNMKDGSMFAALYDYDKKETWENNPLIFFNTLNEYHVYKIFAVYRTSANLGEEFYDFYQFVDAENEQQFDEFVAKCKEYASYDTGITPKYGDKLITLSTCEYTHGGGNGRLVVSAVRIA